MRRAISAIGVLMAVAGSMALLFFPHTQPNIILCKMRIAGPRFVYGPLAYDDARWDIVLAGVRSGKPAWLRVASGLKPALDTHPGEEMLGAVSQVMDVNPAGALEILSPRYGVKTVCAEDEEGGIVSKERANARLKSLKTIPDGQVERRRIDSCIQEIEKVLGAPRPQRQAPR